MKECKCKCHKNPADKIFGKSIYCSKCIKNHEKKKHIHKDSLIGKQAVGCCMKIKCKHLPDCKCRCHPNKTKGAIACTECMDYAHKVLSTQKPTKHRLGKRLSTDWEERLKTVEFGFAVDSKKLIDFIKDLLKEEREKYKQKLIKRCQERKKKYYHSECKQGSVEICENCLGVENFNRVLDEVEAVIKEYKESL